MAIKNTVKQDQKSAVYCSLSQVVQIYTLFARVTQLPKEENDYRKHDILCFAEDKNVPAVQVLPHMVVHDAAQHVEVLLHVRGLRIQPELRRTAGQERTAFGEHQQIL